MTPSERYKKLEQHLAQENPVLLDVLKLYQLLDKVGYRTGVLSKQETFVANISWWPLISILGTFSAGKSSFINTYLEQPVQTTGNQAVDDKFTVICYGKNKEVTTLPGLALDADPRFPFFEISKEIEKVEAGEGAKVDEYLQLKTVNAEKIKGKILIDSPGFDADEQRHSTLKITDHIIRMSDLVLVFFDARHPEPGAMRDTLEHLVEHVIQGNESTKVLFILNQIDTAAKEDNPEEVISAWQRAIAQKGLVTGNFFAIYNEDVAVDIADSQLLERFKRKKDEDLQRIFSRMEKVGIDRSYRITDSVTKLAHKLKRETLPNIQKALAGWRRKTLMWDGLVFGLLIIGLGVGVIELGFLDQPLSQWPIINLASASLINALISIVVLFTLVLGGHYYIRNKVCKREVKRWEAVDPMAAKALAYNNRFWRGMFPKSPRGWGRRTFKMLDQVQSRSKQLIQKLNDQFADPSGQLTETGSSITKTTESTLPTPSEVIVNTNTKPPENQ